MKVSAVLCKKRFVPFLLCLALTAALLCPAAAQDAGGQRVRVGWYESPFNATDQFGRRSGYAYEYQQKIAAFTGWEYEYVLGTWPELMELLLRGDIDLLSDVSYTAERAQAMLFSSLPMGAEEYYLFVSPDSGELRPEDVAFFSGKRVGVNKGSVQADFFRIWAAQHSIEAELVELTESKSAAVQMVRQGALDAYITLDAFGGVGDLVPVCKIGASDFFFAVSKNRPDLLNTLNAAMSSIQDVDRYYNQQLYDKYIKSSGASLYLSAAEKDWLTGHGVIRVGYQDNYLAFCAADPETGKLTGALKDYLELAADCLINADLTFEPVAYSTAAAAMDAVISGEVDCMFPANLSDYDAELLGTVMTPSLMRTNIDAVVLPENQKEFSFKPDVVVAVNEGNPNYDIFLQEHFPGWQVKYFADTQACLEGIASGKADCLLISNYRFSNISKQCDKLHLTAVYTGVDMDYSFALRRGNVALYSILSKVNSLVPASSISAALSYYSAEEAKTSLGDLIREHLTLVMGIVAAVALLIAGLLLWNLRTEKKASAGQRLIEATETDPLTGLYHRSYFFAYVYRMYREHPDRPMDAIALNIEGFHSINAMNGREFGNEALKVLGSEIHTFLAEGEGIACRYEGDRFEIFCPHTEDYRSLFNTLQARMDAMTRNISIRLRMGVAPWTPGTEPTQMFDRARTACAMARSHYKNHLIIYDRQMREREVYEQRLLNDLRRAVEDREFVVYYQPKYDIQSDPPRLKSAEALVRWQHPQLGLIPPGDFIPLFERHGQIAEVDKFVWAESVRQIAAWRNQYGVTVPVSVNLSRMDVFDPGLESTLDRLIAENGLERNCLKLEVTESAYTDDADQVIRVIGALRKKGYEIEMDDFGTGYSSLNMLSSMPVDILKMDRGFIRDIDSNEKNMRLVELILDIARSLCVPVVAEGVETENQMVILRRLGCDEVQGYYFSKPLPAREFENEIIMGIKN